MAVAVIDKTGSYTYEQLWLASGQIVRRLQLARVRYGDVVAIMLPSGRLCIAAMLAVARIGGVYLPIDEDDPPARREQILTEASPVVVIVDRQDAVSSPGLGELVLDAEGVSVRSDLVLVPSAHTGGHALYLLYTSGSTGRPKGVLIEHRGVVNLVTEPRFGFSSQTVMAHCARDAFDVSTLEIWGPLTMGGTCVVLAPREVLDPAVLAASIRNHQIDTMFLTTAVLNFLAQERMPEFRLLRILFFGGERASPQHLLMMIELLAGSGTRLINAYGPTENTMMSTLIDIDEHNYREAPIGTPLHNTQAYLIDDNGAVLAGDATGELCVSGPGLARCYLNRPDLTAERFMTLQLDTGPQRVYRTGDECRRAAGVLTFVGRRDGMVKMQGHRVELGEIEAALLEHEHVTGAAVAADKHAGNARLVGYLRGKERVSDRAVRHFLVDRIPRYMIPAQFVWVEEFPLDANGKVDRRVLFAVRGADATGRVAPAVPTAAGRLRIRPERFEATLRNLARIGADPRGGLSRVGLGAAETEARLFLREIAHEAGLSASIDPAANLLVSRRPLDQDRDGRPILLFGSHLDTVQQGGWLDGAYGVVAAIEALATLSESGLQCAVEPVAVAFSNEEGALIQYPFWGSRALAGSLTGRARAIDREGNPVDGYLIAAGGDPDRLADARWHPESVVGFLELHIEQGTRLESQRVPIGVVDAITGRSIFEIDVSGQQGHPGTTSMHARHDALAAAACIVLEVERLSAELGVCPTSTVGFIENHPNTTNTIPGLVRMTAEIRGVARRGLEQGEAALRRAVNRIAEERGVTVTFARSHRSDPVRTAPFLRDAVAAAAASIGAKTLVMSSAAGHDAQIVATIAPVGMIFVPSRAGVSHEPCEHTDMDYLRQGADVLLRAVASLVTTQAAAPEFERPGRLS